MKRVPGPDEPNHPITPPAPAGATPPALEAISPGADIAGGGAAEPTGGAHNVAITVILLVVLPFFGQSFYYMSQWPAVYYLSKAWPVIVVLLTLRGLTSADAPLRPFFLVLLAYLLGIAPVVAMANWGGGLADAMLTTVKVWPFTYYFALLALLRLLAPTPRQLACSMLAPGVATFVLMPLLWLTIPESGYSTDAVGAKFLLYDVERGYRIYMPMFFGVLLLFYLVRRLQQQRELWVALAILCCFAMLVFIYKQRMTIAAAAVVAGLALIPPRWFRLAAALVLCGGTAAAVGAGFSPFAASVQEVLGGSLSVRLQSLRSAFAYLGDNPFGWLVGMGAMSRFGEVTMGDILGNDFFFLADIGWAGIVFEYGLAGAALILAIHFAGFHLARGLARGEAASPFVMAVGDYILFMLVQSAVYSLVFVPGEFASLLAIAVYLGRPGGTAPTDAPQAHTPAAAIHFEPRPPAILHAPACTRTRR